MLKTLNEKQTGFSWIGQRPGIDKRTALLVPVYNENKNGYLGKRVAYFKEIAEKFGEEMDVIIINDGSSDGSLEIIKEIFTDAQLPAFYLASVNPNGNKVGALFMTILAISHYFVILSDFDTDLSGVEVLLDHENILNEDPELMGCYFRMLPFEGAGKVFRYQQLEYALARNLYKFHEKDLSVRVMPGAGSCYKREILISIFDQHSGLRSGEDRESTLIGLKLGFKTLYLPKVLALTRPPLTFKALIKQRIRWNLGYLETFCKEKNYYGVQLTKGTRIGLMTLSDMLSVVFMILLPFSIVGISLIGLHFLLAFFIVLYTAIAAGCISLLQLSPFESDELKGIKISSVLYFPFFKLSVDYISWMGALLTFLKK
ncbi:glycosyltransferase family 2 protein [Flavitalea flava]